MQRGEVPTRDLSAFTARQLLSLNDKNLSEKLTKVWGVIRPPSGDKTKLLAHYLSLTPPDALKKADRSHGRAVFAAHLRQVPHPLRRRRQDRPRT